MEQQRGQQPMQDNPETRFIHIQDPASHDVGTPIDEAVNIAFDNAHVKDVAGISPELIAQITQNVIQQLKTTGVADTAQTPVTAIPPVNPLQQHSPGPASVRSAGSPPPRIFTPPSPQKHSETHDMYADRVSREPSSPSATKLRSSSNVSAKDETSERSRPPPTRKQTEEATTLEKIWGKLFDEDGKGTARLSQFLRGVATHLIEDVEPKHSIVVTPSKMIAFYESTKIARELYPWSLIFDDAQTSISRMYRQLNIPHHLVQEEDRWDLRPDIPGLTAKGFEKWQTLIILAHPEAELERLHLALRDMAIDNPDDRKERFPKEIPQRLFPKKDRLDVRDRLIEAIEQHAKLDLIRDDDPPTPRTENPQQRHDSDDGSHDSFNDGPMNADGSFSRGRFAKLRTPYSRIPPESAIVDDLTPSISTPIERERKPYSAAPGGGKLYGDQDDGAPLSHSMSSSALPPPPPPMNGNNIDLSRSASNSSRPINIPPPPPKSTGGVHRMSASEYGSPLYNFHGAPHLRDPVGPRRRNQSPMGNDLRRSETDLRGYANSGTSLDPPGQALRDGFGGPPAGLGGGPPAGQYTRNDPVYEEDRRYWREEDLRRDRENYTRGGSPSRRGTSGGGAPRNDDGFAARPPRQQQTWSSNQGYY